jgi:acyl transferase domain-containing protein
MSNLEDKNPSKAVLEHALLKLRQLRTRLEEVENAQLEPIAVIGAACRLPGGVLDLESYAEFLRKGTDAIQTLPDRSDEALLPAEGSVRWAGIIEGADRFDAGFFGISPQEAVRMDPQQRVALEVAWEVFEHAGVPPERAQDTGVFIGVYNSDYLLLQVAAGFKPDVYTGPGNSHSIVANRISYTFDLRGPSIAVDTACSSSLLAIHLACQSLRQQECETALAGGVNLILSRWSNEITSRVLPIAPDGRCKSFDARANGIVRAEGCGLVLLKRLSRALKDGDRILAVVAGSAVNQDGRSNGLTAPNLLAQQQVIRRALEQARISPEDIGLIEAHGTGTALGDPIEVEALVDIYGKSGTADSACALTSVKANLGHLEAAAGIAAFLKAILSVRNGELYPQPNFECLNPNIRLQGSRLYVPRTVSSWTAPSGSRCACVSSFGFGGTNVHLIVRQAPANMEVETDSCVTTDGGGKYLLPISDRSMAGLAATARTFSRLLDQPESLTPEAIWSICYTASVRRSHHKHRVAVFGRPNELAGLLAQRLHNLEKNGNEATRLPRGCHFNVALFLAGDDAWRDNFTARLLQNERLRRFYEARRASLEDSSQSLTGGVLALQVAILDWLRDIGIVAQAVGGAGCGAAAAAFAAGSIDFTEAARQVSIRETNMAPMPDPATEAHCVDEFLRQGCNVLLPAGRLPFGEAGRSSSAMVSIDLFADDADPAVFELDLYRRLFEAGFPLNWSALYASKGSCVDLPRHEWQHERYWVEAGPGALFPRMPSPPSDPGAEKQRPEFTSYLQHLIQDILPDDEKRLVTLDQPLDGLGLDSLTVLDLRDKVEREFQVNIPLPLLLRGPSIRQIAASIEPEIQMNSQEARGLLDQVSEMREDQIDQLLKKLLPNARGAQEISKLPTLIDDHR